MYYIFLFNLLNGKIPLAVTIPIKCKPHSSDLFI